MPAQLQVESTLTEKYQATVPDAIRKALRLNKGDRIRFTLQPDGSVVLSRAEVEQTTDAELKPFLRLLARELDVHPEAFRALPPSLVKQARAVTKALRDKGALRDEED
ncbi:MAG: type II toxin-antitoxin system PrlF family antitoxin [Proteobacteria bacterium]|nr:type II toxin-antitoxin system PrlF family antitoxin [Pseudomonadota bacterium]